MITCKLCSTVLTKKQLRRDGSMLCPVCGQVYWKAAVEKAQTSAGTEHIHTPEEIWTEYRAESRRSTELIRRVRVA